MNASIFVGLGSNLGSNLGSDLHRPVDQIRSAIQALRDDPEIELVAVSSLYRTQPWGEPDQADFINAVAEIRTGLEPEPLLQRLLSLEVHFGRRREEGRWGPRTLDLDLLAYADRRVQTETLHLPHPLVAERAFVLVPWAEIAAGFQVPGMAAVADLLAACADTGQVERIEDD